MAALEPLNGHVLLVEDNPVNQAVALGLLEELGCEAVVAINGQEAVERFTEEKFDVVLMDCEMPVMDGFEATNAIRSQPGGASDIPIIALTANVVEGDRERCIESGMQDYLSKPISVENLHGTLKRWLPPGRNGSNSVSHTALDSSSLDSIRNLKGIGGDKMVRRVVKLYLSNSSMLLEDLRLAIGLVDAEAERQSAHALKSSSVNVGACGLADVCKEIEAMGRSGDLGLVNDRLAQLEDLYPKTIDALKFAIDTASDC